MSPAVSAVQGGTVAPVDVVLHIGSDKTGTTTVQQALRRSRQVLADHGVLYPRSPGRVRHVELGLAARSDENLPKHRDYLRGDYPPPPAFRRRLRRRLAREVAAAAPTTVLLSDEALFRMPADAVERVRDLVAGAADGRVRLVAYLRRQDAHLASFYQQAVKVGEARPMRQWVAERDFTAMYDYRQRIETWQQGLAPDVVAVRAFEPSRFRDGSLLQDFLDAAGLDLAAGELSATDVRNERLGAETVELLRVLNVHRLEQGAEPWQISNRAYVRALRGEDQGDQLTLPEADLDRFVEQWAAPNAWVAREHLGDPGGTLFHEPRRSTGTTPVQVLDPARLDHYLDLLEVPVAGRVGIRAVAEREAARQAGQG